MPMVRTILPPISSAGGRIRARHARVPSSASCSPTSGAPTADDFVRRAGGYGSASASPSGPPQSAPSGRRCPPRPPCRYWRDRAHRPASDCRARPRPSHPICGSACAPCPRRGGSCSRRSSHRSSSSSARVLVLLGILGGLLLPFLRRLAGLDRLVLLLRVALPGHQHNRGVNDLAAARNIALSLKMLAEALKQLVDQPGLRQRLAKQPNRGGIRHRVLELQIEKAHERYAVADQVLSPIVREIVERLQH